MADPLNVMHVPEANLKASKSDGSTAKYYELPPNCTQLQDLISFKNMNAQLGEIQRAVYRYGEVAHSERERDLKKIIFYAQAELDRLKKYPAQTEPSDNLTVKLLTNELADTKMALAELKTKLADTMLTNTLLKARSIHD